MTKTLAENKNWSKIFIKTIITSVKKNIFNSILLVQRFSPYNIIASIITSHDICYFYLFFNENLLENVIKVFQNHMKQTWTQGVHFCRLGTGFFIFLEALICHWLLNVNLWLCFCWASIHSLHVLSWAGTRSSVHCRILHTMCGSVKAEVIYGREESAEVKNHGKIGTWVSVSPKIRTCLPLSVISMSVYIQIVCWIHLLFCHLSLRGGGGGGLPFLLEIFGMLFWMAKMKWTVPPCLCSVPRGPSLPWLAALGTLSAGQ